MFLYFHFSQILYAGLQPVTALFLHSVITACIMNLSTLFSSGLGQNSFFSLAIIIKIDIYNMRDDMNKLMAPHCRGVST